MFSSANPEYEAVADYDSDTIYQSKKIELAGVWSGGGCF
jgi:hypothetical protein